MEIEPQFVAGFSSLRSVEDIETRYQHAGSPAGKSFSSLRSVEDIETTDTRSPDLNFRGFSSLRSVEDIETYFVK